MNTRAQFFFLALGAAGLLYAVILTPQQAPPSWKSSAEEQEAYWKHRIEDVGGKRAYAEFSTYAHAQEKEFESIGHVLAHRFGSALYEQLGADGVAVCDTQFSFGCLHEWFKRAVAEYGTAPLQKMAEACKESIGIWHPCQHAIGHGILANEGYTEESLLNALRVCEAEYNEDPMNGCYGGVFMEYNLYTTQAIRVDPRSPGDDWYAPCSTLPEEYLRSCYYWLPQWWHEYLRITVATENVEQRFIHLGELCGSIPDARFARECVERVGQLTVHGAGFDSEKVKDLCAVSFKTQTERLMCRSYAAYIFSNVYDNGLERGLAVCADLPSVEKEYCDSYARKEFFTPRDRALPESSL